MKVVRDSKFRHVFGEPSKQKYEDIRLSSKATESLGIRANPKFVSFPWESGGGGTLAVVPVPRLGRLPRDLPLVTGHSGPILDFEFNPFDDNMILSCSEDTTIKLWQIPDEGLQKHLSDPLASLDGHGKKVSFATFNPSVNCIVASASFDLTCRVWNLAEQEEAYRVEVPEQLLSLKWNSSGSLLAATCKDKKMHIIDPRVSAIVASCKIHEGAKASKVEWLGSTNNLDECFKLVTTGFSQQAERQVGVWDMRRFPAPSAESHEAEPVNMIIMDQGTGALYPIFDIGTQMLYIAGKGDANVRYFEVTPEDPYLHFLDHFRTNVPQKGFCLAPKRAVNVSKHEIMAGYKLEANAVQPISFRVPRKSEAFQEDLYPDCPSGMPAMAPDEFLAGAEARMPLLMSMDPATRASGGATPKAAAAPAAGFVSMKDLKAQLAEANARIQALEKENELLKAELEKVKAA